MTLAVSSPVGADVAHVRCSTTADGDFHIDGSRLALGHRRQAFAPGAWTQLDEVHGTRVVTVTEPGEHDFDEADAAVTRRRDVVLSVWVGDCAPVALLGDDGTVGVAHVGWRGAIDGVLQHTVQAMRELGTTSLRAVVGPCIGPCCNEFGADLLRTFRDRFGPHVASTTTWGAPSLDLPAVVVAALAEWHVPVTMLWVCTRCDPRFFSHRRGELGRQVMTVQRMAAA